VIVQQRPSLLFERAKIAFPIEAETERRIEDGGRIERQF